LIAKLFAVEALLHIACCSTTLVLCISSSGLLLIFPAFPNLSAWLEMSAYVFFSCWIGYFILCSAKWHTVFIVEMCSADSNLLLLDNTTAMLLSCWFGNSKWKLKVIALLMVTLTVLQCYFSNSLLTCKVLFWSSHETLFQTTIFTAWCLCSAYIHSTCCVAVCLAVYPLICIVWQWVKMFNTSICVRDILYVCHTHVLNILTHCQTRMWANAQRDGLPAEYRWHPLFSTAKFGWGPLLECRTVTLPRHETHWNLLGCPKLANRSQPLVGRKCLHLPCRVAITSNTRW